MIEVKLHYLVHCHWHKILYINIDLFHVLLGYHLHLVKFKFLCVVLFITII